MIMMIMIMMIIMMITFMIMNKLITKFVWKDRVARLDDDDVGDDE